MQRERTTGQSRKLPNTSGSLSNQLAVWRQRTYHPDSKGDTMILGMSLSTFTVVHVLLGLVGIGSGLLVVYGLLLGRRFDRATAIFLVTNSLTALTRFLFPFARRLPSHVLGILSLAALVVAMMARYARYLAGAWRPTYVVCAVAALYFNVFVLVA